MGRIVTPTFRIEYTLAKGFMTNGAWPKEKNMGGGRPTVEALTRWVLAMEKSCLPGGCNAHLGSMDILAARIVRQATGDVVATYSKPAPAAAPSPAPLALAA